VIKARFLNNGGVTCGFEVSGHADYAGKGHDIVCASVSSAVQMAANTVTEVIGVAASVSDVGGKVTFCLSKRIDQEKTVAAVAVIEGLRLHLSILSKQYRGTISIEDSEV
jgi:uncharacterized protein